MSAQPDLFAARVRRDAGMARAVTHAGDEWAQLARHELQRFAARQRLAETDGEPAPWLAEEFIAWFAEQGNPLPPDKRAFGAVITRARRDGIIRECGASKSTTNCCYKPLWVMA